MFMKKWMDEFKKFAFQGNVFDMAIGIIIGSAFKGIVDALVNDIISPLFGLFSTADLHNMELVLRSGTTAEENVTLRYGSFLSAVINFLLMAFVLFSIVKAVNVMRANGKKEEDKKETPIKRDTLTVLEEIRDLLAKRKLS